jgi:hypothetical protein
MFPHRPQFVKLHLLPCRGQPSDNVCRPSYGICFGLCHKIHPLSVREIRREDAAGTLRQILPIPPEAFHGTTGQRGNLVEWLVLLVRGIVLADNVCSIELRLLGNGMNQVYVSGASNGQRWRS